MSILIISQIVRGKNTIGYRLFDTQAKGTKDCDIEGIKRVLSANPNKPVIQNATLVNNTVTGTNGQLSRYPKIDVNGRLIGNSSLIVLNKIDDIGYTVCDFKGQVVKMKTSDVVEYAKKNGIANGKVATNDNVEYISSISGNYEQISLEKTSKVGRNTGIDIRISVDGNAASVAKHTEQSINTELEYNDVFKALTADQRKVLKQYYTWYTVDAFKKMAKHVRLDLAPGKAEKLAGLRGTTKWMFAGINDSFLEMRFNAKCELGHRLRYEYYAIPEEDSDDTKFGINDRYRMAGESKEDRAARLASKSDRLVESGAIIFGETCSGDFFNIAPEDMKKLVKIRKTMSDEIELQAAIAANNTKGEYITKCRFLYDCIKAMGSKENVANIFGKEVGYTLLAYIAVGLPFTQSLVILAGDKIRENPLKFYKTILPKYDKAFERLLNQTISNSNVTGAACEMLDYIVKYSIEGRYQYDPLHDNTNSRRDIGAYNKNTREVRSRCLRNFKSKLNMKEADLESLESIDKIMNILNIFISITDEVNKRVKASESLTAIAFKDRDRKIKIGGINSYSWDSYQLTSRILHSLDKVSSDIDVQKHLFYIGVAISINPTYCSYGKLGYVLKNENISKYGERIYDLEELERIYTKELAEPIAEMGITAFLDKYFKPFELEADKAYEDFKDLDLLKPVNAEAFIDSNSTEVLNSLNGKPCILETTRKDLKELDKKMTGLEYDTDKVYEVYKWENISINSLIGYKILTEDEKDALEDKFYHILIQEQIDEENRQAEEKARQEEEKERLKKEEEERKQKEKEDKFNKDETMKKLIELLDANKDNADYGVTVARDIANRKVPFDELSSKQQWRVTETIKQLGGQVEQASEQSLPTKKKLDEHAEVKEKVDKLLEILKNKDKDNMKKVESASKIAFDIAKTINYKGEFSDKQLKHINKAYEAIQ